MRVCALCKETARAFCESDQASLCWSCDAKVHGANFLVARHSRTLLCRACQSLTPWKASGPKLGGRTVSFCDSCLRLRDYEEGGGDNEDHGDDEDDEEEEEEEERSDAAEGGGDGSMDEEEDGTEEGDNQVVPWSSSFPAGTPPPPASCSSSDEDDLASSGSLCHGSERKVEEAGMCSLKLKRSAKDSADLPSQELMCSPAKPIRRPASRKTSVHSSRPSKYRKAGPDGGVRFQTCPDS